MLVALQDKFCCLNRMDRQFRHLSRNELDGQKMGIGPADPNQEKILESFFKKSINGFFYLCNISQCIVNDFDKPFLVKMIQV